MNTSTSALRQLSVRQLDPAGVRLKGGKFSRYGDQVSEEMARPLPYRDVHALFDVVVNVYSALFSGLLPPGVVDEMTRRIANDGFLDEDVSAGELTAFIGDLVQRLHYAMGSGDTLPDPSPRLTWHIVHVPTESVGAACRSELIELGSPAVDVREAEPDGWEVVAAFPELPPDQSFADRVAQLEVVARQQGGQYTGSEGG